MKHLKLFEFENNGNIEQRLKNTISEFSTFQKLFETYLYWKFNDLEYLNDDSHYIFIYEFYFKEDKFVIKYDYCGDYDEWYIVTDYDEMLQFIEDPDLFIEQEKFNL